MISWLAAQCDGNEYGHLIEYAFSKDKLVYGPYQIQARINQNPEISRQMSLWNQMGSRVILGNCWSSRSRIPCFTSNRFTCVRKTANCPNCKG